MAAQATRAFPSPRLRRTRIIAGGVEFCLRRVVRSQVRQESGNIIRYPRNRFLERFWHVTPTAREPGLKLPDLTARPVAQVGRASGALCR
jgi:hypothetical protein